MYFHCIIKYNVICLSYLTKNILTRDVSVSVVDSLSNILKVLDSTLSTERKVLILLTYCLDRYNFFLIYRSQVRHVQYYSSSISIVVIKTLKKLALGKKKDYHSQFQVIVHNCGEVTALGV